MKINYFKSTFNISQPLSEPPWNEKVPRWYQLDGPALALCQLFFEHDFHFNYLLLASPTSSNETEREFVLTGAQRAQKFVHTLPNIRASMALQVVNKVTPFLCFTGGTKSLENALKEFYSLNLENKQPALVCTHKVSTAGGNKLYEAWGIVKSREERPV